MERERPGGSLKGEGQAQHCREEEDCEQRQSGRNGQGCVWEQNGGRAVEDAMGQLRDRSRK